VPATAKAWDAERLYDKRLLGAMAKDKCTRLDLGFFYDISDQAPFIQPL
jgi:hypothetical protein